MKISVGSSKVSSWAARIGVGAVAVGTLLAVQVANADRPQSTQDIQHSATEQVVGQTAIRHETPRPAASAENASAGVVAGSMFYAIAPYRAFDSRTDPQGPLVAGSWYAIAVTATSIPIVPSNAVAVTYNLTATATVGSGGYLALVPGGQPWYGNSSINWWTSGLDIANGGVVGLGTYAPEGWTGVIDVLMGDVPGTQTHFLIDITGYYAP